MAATARTITNGGMMNHFVTNNDPNGQSVDVYYKDDTVIVIPFYYPRAGQYLCHRLTEYHASVDESYVANRFFPDGGERRLARRQLLLPTRTRRPTRSITS